MLSVPGPERKRCPEDPFEPGRLQGLPEPGLQHNNALFLSTPHHHHRALGRLNGAMGRGSRGGGGQAVEEVISPQLAPLPRSLKGRRKPPGPPPVIPSPRQSGLNPRSTGADASSGHPALQAGHICPHRIGTGLSCKAKLSSFPNAYQASASPSVQWSRGPLPHSTVRFH